MTTRIAGHTREGLRRLLRHQYDDLYALPEDDPRAFEIEKQIIQTRKNIRKQLKEDLENELANSKL